MVAQSPYAAVKEAVASLEAYKAQLEKVPEEGFVLEAQAFYLAFEGGPFAVPLNPIVVGLQSACVFGSEAAAAKVAEAEIRNGNQVKFVPKPIAKEKFLALAGVESSIEFLLQSPKAA